MKNDLACREKRLIDSDSQLAGGLVQGDPRVGCRRVEIFGLVDASACLQNGGFAEVASPTAVDDG